MKHKQKKPPTKIKKVMQRLTTITCLVVFTASAYYLIDTLFEYKENREVLADIQDVYKQSKEDNQDSPDTVASSKTIRTSFNDLLSINEDIVGWISIGDTVVNYPILQAEENEYYLNRNYKEEESRAGSIFMDYRNDIQSSDRHTVLYGHNMKDGSMFGDMDNFLEQTYFQEHQQVFFDTLYESYDVELFSVYQTTTDFYYIETDFPDDNTYQAFLDEIQGKSSVETNVEVSTEDQIITFSTCDYFLSPNEGRLVIHGKLVKKE